MLNDLERVFLLHFWYIYRVVCKCGSCGPERKALSEWERHTGSKAKNWKTSVKVKSSKLPLEEWVCANFPLFLLHLSFQLHKSLTAIYSFTLQMMKLAEFHANATAAKPPKRPSIKQRKQRLLSFLRGIKQFGSQNLAKGLCFRYALLMLACSFIIGREV